MSLVPVVAAERRKAVAENSFALRPATRFPAAAVREMLGALLAERLAPTAAKDWKYSSEGTKPLAEAIRQRLKALQLSRYKFVVHVVVAENRGQGFKLASRCLWDASIDDVATESYTNDNIFAVATVFGVYLY